MRLHLPTQCLRGLPTFFSPTDCLCNTHARSPIHTWMQTCRLAGHSSAHSKVPSAGKPSGLHSSGILVREQEVCRCFAGCWPLCHLFQGNQRLQEIIPMENICRDNNGKKDNKETKLMTQVVTLNMSFLDQKWRNDVEIFVRAPRPLFYCIWLNTMTCWGDFYYWHYFTDTMWMMQTIAGHSLVG